MNRKEEMIEELKSSNSEFVTYGNSDLGIPIKRKEAIDDISGMDEEMIGEGTWYECDSEGNIVESEYRIYVKYYYYNGTLNVPKNGQLLICGEPTAFGTRQMAIDFLEEPSSYDDCGMGCSEVSKGRWTEDGEDGVYFLNLSLGEYDRPEYRIRKYTKK